MRKEDAVSVAANNKDDERQARATREARPPAASAMRAALSPTLIRLQLCCLAPNPVIGVPSLTSCTMMSDNTLAGYLVMTAESILAIFRYYPRINDPKAYSRQDQKYSPRRDQALWTATNEPRYYKRRQ
jgi:hypothetical protein